MNFIDVDECADASKNLCDKTNGECTNTDGGYNCSCKAGYKLGQDKLTCEACSKSRWGKDCTNLCNCKSGSTCNKETGERKHFNQSFKL